MKCISVKRNEETNDRTIRHFRDMLGHGHHETRQVKCLSVRQPWAWLIVHQGKDIENRTWATQYRGPLLIHAGKTKLSAWDRELLENFCRDCEIAVPELDFGAVIGQVELVDCVTRSRSPWWQGPIGWRLANPSPLPARPLAGQLGIFDVDL